MPAKESAPKPAAPAVEPAAPAVETDAGNTDTDATVIDIAALTAAPAVRPPTYRVPTGAPCAAFGAQLISRGVNVKTGVPHYVLQNGSAQTGFPVAAVAVAILEGIVPRDEIIALFAAADARAQAA